ACPRRPDRRDKSGGSPGERRIKSAGEAKVQPPPPRRPGSALPRELLLHLELGVDDALVLAATALAAIRGAAGAPLGAARLLALVEVLRHRVHRLLEVAQRLLDGVDVLAAGRLLDALDGAGERRLVLLGEVGRVVAQQLLRLVDELVGVVAGVDQV